MISVQFRKELQNLVQACQNGYSKQNVHGIKAGRDPSSSSKAIAEGKVQ
jgi:hypothetical protein